MSMTARSRAGRLESTTSRSARKIASSISDVTNRLVRRFSSNRRRKKLLHQAARNPKDVIFVNPEDGTPESFIRAQAP
jgi:hypothetical protein